jgi:hypothetical protein
VCLVAVSFAQEAPVAPPVAAPTALEELPELGGVRGRSLELGRQLTGFQGLAGIGLSTLSDQVTNYPKEWTRSPSGFGKRLASESGQFVITKTIEFGVSALHHEDPRYFRMPGASTKRRLGHAIASAFVARKADDTGSTIALGHLAGVYGSWAIAQSWEPHSATGAEQFFIWGTANMITKTVSNAVREFWPDVKRKLFPRVD